MGYSRADGMGWCAARASLTPETTTFNAGCLWSSAPATKIPIRPCIVVTKRLEQTRSTNGSDSWRFLAVAFVLGAATVGGRIAAENRSLSNTRAKDSQQEKAPMRPIQARESPRTRSRQGGAETSKAHPIFWPAHGWSAIENPQSPAKQLKTRASILGLAKRRAGALGPQCRACCLASLSPPIASLARNRCFRILKPSETQTHGSSCADTSVACNSAHNSRLFCWASPGVRGGAHHKAGIPGRRLLNTNPSPRGAFRLGPESQFQHPAPIRVVKSQQCLAAGTKCRIEFMMKATQRRRQTLPSQQARLTVRAPMALHRAISFGFPCPAITPAERAVSYATVPSIRDSAHPKQYASARGFRKTLDRLPSSRCCIPSKTA
ncbi:hypothetical protein IQ07DRAFT_600918 [Pyrenochaeta sp. DS3sAY3a]|nr:hypothetical protein IQ07DRAFT_600918 [Pyrenochaeta sp. DS3sAY3a]